MLRKLKPAAADADAIIVIGDLFNTVTLTVADNDLVLKWFATNIINNFRLCIGIVEHKLLEFFNLDLCEI